MSATPWNSIQESTLPDEETRMSYREALRSPCLSCATSPCCTHLPLQTFNIRNLIELDHAIYLLNFERIELGLSASGEWSVYYCCPCRFLKRNEFTCTIHSQPEQPQICVNYNPYHCWYKKVLTKSISDDFIRIDRQRIEYIISLLIFDELRNIIHIPDWETLTKGISNLPSQTPPDFSEPPTEDLMTEMWKQQVLHGEEIKPEEQKTYTYEQLRTPCSDCQAYCCKTLVFPQSQPCNISNLDFFRFCLGFPGIELGIADDMWSIIVKTNCRHLQDNRCSIYGQPERPILCKYYDEWKCSYKSNFGLPKPPGFLRITLEQFPQLSQCFQFDHLGNIIQFPPTEAIRTSIEEQWRLSVTVDKVSQSAIVL